MSRDTKKTVPLPYQEWPLADDPTIETDAFDARSVSRNRVCPEIGHQSPFGWCLDVRGSSHLERYRTPLMVFQT